MIQEALIPISVAVVLPITIVLITSLTRINADNKRSQVIIKAIEANKDVDTDKLIESLKKSRKSAREILYARLQRGCMYSLIGLILMAVALGNFASGIKFSDEPVGLLMTFGGISIAIGLSYLITYFVTRKQVESSSKD